MRPIALLVALLYLSEAAFTQTQRSYLIQPPDVAAATGPRPTCSDAVRSRLWITQSSTGTADAYQVCLRDAAGAYSWVSLEAAAEIAELVVNVKDYGATGDGRQVTDAVTTNLSTTVTSATANFDSARDVGKLVWGADLIGGPDGSDLSVPLGTIVSVTNSTTIEVSAAAVASNTGVALAWGTDDTDALQAAFAEAFNGGARGPKRTIYLPAGMYLIDELLGDWRSSATQEVPPIIGSGSKTTTFMYKPDFDFDTTFAGKGMLVATTDAIAKYQGFTVTGNSYSFSASLKFAIVMNGSGSVARDIVIHHVQSLAGASGGIYLNTCGGFEASEKCWLEDYFVYAVSGFAFLTGSSVGVIRNISNFEVEAMQIDNNSHMIVEGGNFGDHFNPPDGDALVVSLGSTAILVGTKIRHRLKIVDANTAVVCYSCIINDVASGNRSAVSIAAGASFRFSDSRLTSWGTGARLDNAGSAYEGSGNTYTAGSGSGGFTTAAPYGSSKPTVVTLLPTCNSGAAGQRNPVTDSNTVVWGETVAGSSTNHVLAYCNGTNWTVAAK